MENGSGQKDCRKGICLSGMVSGFIIEAPGLQILGASAGITTCRSTVGWMVGVVDTDIAGIGWWLIFGVGHISEVSMRTSGRYMGARGVAHHHRWDCATVSWEGDGFLEH